jgi:hypothetical protein
MLRQLASVVIFGHEIEAAAWCAGPVLTDFGARVLLIEPFSDTLGLNHAEQWTRRGCKLAEAPTWTKRPDGQLSGSTSK